MTTTAFIEAAAKAHKLWGGRFSGSGTAPQFDALNNSIGVDVRLWPFDVELMFKRDNEVLFILRKTITRGDA